MKPYYPFPWAILPGLISASLKVETRSFRVDSNKLLPKIYPPVIFIGNPEFSFEKPLLLTVNHYARPGFSIMWVVIAISSYIPMDVHWIMTNAWVYPNRIQNIGLKPLSHIILNKIAHIYKFTAMPPMPPTPADVVNRAMAVRKMFEFIRKAKMPVIGMAPEGRDMATGVLGWPPPGTGKLILELSQRGFSILPIGAYEEEGALCIRFGKPYELIVPAVIPATELDKYVSQTIMHQIAINIPVPLRGEFS